LAVKNCRVNLVAVVSSSFRYTGLAAGFHSKVSGKVGMHAYAAGTVGVLGRQHTPQWWLCSLQMCRAGCRRYIGGRDRNNSSSSCASLAFWRRLSEVLPVLCMAS
jgi:hypothetical protein